MSEQQPETKELSAEEKKLIREQKKREKEEQKLKKQKEREERERLAKEQQTVKITEEEFLTQSKSFGHVPIIQSTYKTEYNFTSVKDLNASLNETVVTVRARIHTVRGQGKSCFIVLREGSFTVQATLFANDEETKQMAKYAQKLSKESVIQVVGKVVKVEQEITSATQKDVEIQMQKIYCISAALPLPIQLEDCMKVETKEEQMKQAEEKEEDETTGQTTGPKAVGQKLRLDSRVIDMRAPAQLAIFKIQSAVGRFFREFLYSKDFTEIHTPKLIPTASEGGTEVFKVHYFDRFAYLAQSPQLYKQMSVEGDLMKVFEIGPVFRAEKSFTHRHLTEFVGLDIELAIKSHYTEALDLFDEMLVYIFDRIKEVYSKELEIIRQQYPADPIVYKPKDNLRITYEEAINLLNERHNLGLEPTSDIRSDQERMLGEIIKEKYGTDFFIVDKFPMDLRPFYTMPCPKDERFSNSYDIFIRGEEIASGAQRIHDPELLQEKAKNKNVDLTPIQPYVDAFKYGAWPHAGCGIGLERIVMLYLGLGNVKKTSMFPRDPKRVTP
ncbi:hypothetical protein ABK040_007133 [Willaertia magna]